MTTPTGPTTPTTPTTPFGPQLVGETEKTLRALLTGVLDGTGLSEPQWVTLRLAGILDGSVDAVGLVAAVADRAHFSDAAELVADVRARGLLADGELTDSGRELVSDVLARSAAVTGDVWTAHSADDIAATERVLNEVLRRARAALAA